MKAQLFRGELHYAGVMLHTAASGPVTALDTLWLRLEDQGVTGVGEVRLNIRYLHGYSEEQVLNNLLQILSRWDWRRQPAALLTALNDEDPTLLPPSRMVQAKASAWSSSSLARRMGAPCSVQWRCSSGEAGPSVVCCRAISRTRIRGARLFSAYSPKEHP